MAVTRAKLKAKTRSVIVDLGDGDKISVVYKYNEYTSHVEKQFNAGLKGGLPVGAMAELLSSLITSWDVKESDEAIDYLAPTPEVLEDFGMPVITAIVKSVMEDMQPGE